jgi:hypothetical protein
MSTDIYFAKKFVMCKIYSTYKSMSDIRRHQNFLPLHPRHRVQHYKLPPVH